MNFNNNSMENGPESIPTIEQVRSALEQALGKTLKDLGAVENIKEQDERGPWLVEFTVMNEDGTYTEYEYIREERPDRLPKTEIFATGFEASGMPDMRGWNVAKYKDGVWKKSLGEEGTGWETIKV